MPRIDKWNNVDKILGVSFIAATVVDYSQTTAILKSENVEESNPLIYNRASQARVFIGGTWLYLKLADEVPLYRTPLLILGALFEWYIVAHNKYMGVHIEPFRW